MENLLIGFLNKHIRINDDVKYKNKKRPHEYNKQCSRQRR